MPAAALAVAPAIKLLLELMGAMLTAAEFGALRVLAAPPASGTKRAVGAAAARSWLPGGEPAAGMFGVEHTPQLDRP